MADFGESQDESTDRQMIYEGGKKKGPDILSADGGKSVRSNKSAKPLSQMGSVKGSQKGRTHSQK
jgi:hypothetical protein